MSFLWKSGHIYINKSLELEKTYSVGLFKIFKSLIIHRWRCEFRKYVSYAIQQQLLIYIL